jgi:hypothetical protein
MVEWFYIFRKVKNMSNYAVLDDNGLVINSIVAESKAIAESVTGMTCIEFQLESGAPGIGWTYNGTDFTAPVVEVPVEETLTEETPVE